jgi:hypothetical protein
VWGVQIEALSAQLEVAVGPAAGGEAAERDIIPAVAAPRSGLTALDPVYDAVQLESVATVARQLAARETQLVDCLRQACTLNDSGRALAAEVAQATRADTAGGAWLLSSVISQIISRGGGRACLPAVADRPAHHAAAAAAACCVDSPSGRGSDGGWRRGVRPQPRGVRGRARGAAAAGRAARRRRRGGWASPGPQSLAAPN